MKHLSLLVVAFTLGLTTQAKIWRCNNNSGITADFTSLAAAHNSSSVVDGDTIHLEPSLNSYGDLNPMTKRLTILSIGSFNNINPNFQFSPAESFCGTIIINNPTANGSVISVRYAGQLIVVDNANIANISFINCASTISNTHWCDGTGRITISQADNCIINNCYVTNIDLKDGANNIIVTNNIMSNNMNVTNNSSAIISQNVFFISPRGDCGYQNINNSVVKNNIFKGELPANYFVNCNVTNNYAPNANLPQVAGDGNVNSVDMTTVFTNATGGFGDNYYTIKAGSAALTAGDAGQEIGAFGGNSPFKLAVQPAIPSIYKLQIPATPSGNTMTAVFSTRSN